MRGDFRRANPSAAVSNYLANSAIHMVTDHHRQRQAKPVPPPPPRRTRPAVPSEADTEASFVASWREEMLNRRGKRLADFNPTYRAALQLRVQEPDLTSNAMAERLTTELGKPISGCAGSARRPSGPH